MYVQSTNQLALLSENGPCKASADGLTTENNPFSWNTNANIMWVDQPSNVGYSYGKSINKQNFRDANGQL